MKAQKSKVRLISFVLLLLVNNSFAQLEINTDVTPVQMVENFIGPGLLIHDNVTFSGADVARGLFSGGSNSLNMESGVFLCTGDGNLIPGPNISGTTGIDNGAFGDPTLNTLTTGTTYNASVLQFDFIPINDTLRFFYVFGSEEYNESVLTIWDDLCAAFISGPNPMGGQYSNKNIAIVPGTTNSKVSVNNINNGWADIGNVPMGPCTNCAYYWDNTGGANLEYDGRTVVLRAWINVVPLQEYHVKIAVADVAGTGKDSGIFLEENSLFSPGPAEFTSFDFLTENNPDLPFDITGVIGNQTVYLAVPQNTDVTNLVASYADKGAYIRVEGVNQQNGITLNDFSLPVVYQLHGYDIKNWTVTVDVVVDLPEICFNQVAISPNPASGAVRISNANGIGIILTNVQGKRFFSSNGSGDQSLILIDNLPPGVYVVELKKDGFTQTRKVVIQ